LNKAVQRVKKERLKWLACVSEYAYAELWDPTQVQAYSEGSYFLTIIYIITHRM